MSTTNNAQHQAILSILEQDHIHPEIFKSSLNLRGKLSIAFPSHTACAGETIERVVTKDVPSLVYRPFAGKQGVRKDERYALIMIDPDLLQHNDTISGQVRHWIQSGITFDPAEMDKDGQVVGKYDGERATITEYIPCSPGPPGHKHRYIFCLALESPSNPPTPSDFPHPRKPSSTTPATSSEDIKDRSGFDLESYLSTKGMDAVAVSFIKVGPDEEGMVMNAMLGAEAAVNKVLGR